MSAPSQDREVYCWADGTHLKVRLEQDKVGLQVLLGGAPGRIEELIALTVGHRESSESRRICCATAEVGGTVAQRSAKAAPSWS